MSHYVTRRAPDRSVVVTEKFPSGERSWKRFFNGSYAYCPDHKGAWLATSWEALPRNVRARFAAAPQQQAKEQSR